MSLFDSASVVITPSGYKEDKLYAIKPTDGSGDLVVTRATTATRVNSAGLIEQVPYNLLQRSEQFENAAWLAGGSGAFVVTTNSTTAPNGTLTADKLIAPLTNQTIRQNLANINTAYTLSIYLKTNSGTKQMRLFINDTQIESIVNVTSDWQRFTLSGTTGGTLFGSGRVGIANVSILDNSSFVYAWGAQLVTGTSAKEYFPTTDRLDVARLDYTNSSCPSILVEPQRTNLLLRSQEFDNASWVKTSTTITPNTTISPDGNLNADSMVVSSIDSRVTQVIALGAGTYTTTIYVKVLSQTTAGTMRLQANVDSTNVSVNFTPTTEWQRVTATYNATVGIINFSVRGLGFIGTIAIWGSQMEAGSNATSYIPTVASTVTRNADVISKTGISSLIGQTEGTIYAEVKVSKLIGTASRYVFHLSDGTANNRIYMAFSGASSNILRARIFSGGTLQCSINTSTLTTTGTYKLAMAYKNNDIVFYVNGVQIGTDTSATIPTCSRVDLGHNYAGASQLNDGINNANIWKTRLTNAELATLTTI